ncbi:MAG: ribosome small subunit-dependent GTPase A [Planctomycetia bacterium]
MSEEALLDGTVARVDARGALVRLDSSHAGVPGGGREVFCSVAGRLHLRGRTGQRTPVAAGDRVQVRLDGARGAQVVGLQPRRSMLSRPAAHKGRVEHVLAANVDQVLIVASAADPAFNPALVDRLLAVVAWSRLEPLLVINKMDLAPAEPPEAATYRALGVAVFPVSARTGAGLAPLRARLVGRVSVVTGHSGVGKSSLLNALEPGLTLAVGEVNAVSGRGTHTTSAATHVELAAGGAVIDTAGVREFGLFQVPARELTWLFPDLAQAGRDCRFPDCSHTHEPGCAVEQAVEEGRVAAFRYDSYLKILETMEPPAP